MAPTKAVVQCSTTQWHKKRNTSNSSRGKTLIQLCSWLRFQLGSSSSMHVQISIVDTYICWFEFFYSTLTVGLKIDLTSKEMPKKCVDSSG